MKESEMAGRLTDKNLDLIRVRQQIEDLRQPFLLFDQHQQPTRRMDANVRLFGDRAELSVNVPGIRELLVLQEPVGACELGRGEEMPGRFGRSGLASLQRGSSLDAADAPQG